MNFVWNIDGIKVGSISMNRWAGQQMFTSGWGMIVNRLFQWEITVTPLGWYVTIITEAGRIGEYQTETFNAPLAISTAVRRLL